MNTLIISILEALAVVLTIMTIRVVIGYIKTNNVFKEILNDVKSDKVLSIRCFDISKSYIFDEVHQGHVLLLSIMLDAYAIHLLVFTDEIKKVPRFNVSKSYIGAKKTEKMIPTSAYIIAKMIKSSSIYNKLYDVIYDESRYEEPSEDIMVEWYRTYGWDVVGYEDYRRKKLLTK